MEARGRRVHTREWFEARLAIIKVLGKTDFSAWDDESCADEEMKLMPDSLNKTPTGCLLGACSGQHPMGYRFSLLTLLFSGVIKTIKHQMPIKFRLIL
jgi:hypothetical protein